VLPRFDEETDFIDAKVRKLQDQISQINLMKLKIDTYEDKLKLKQTLDENIKSLESNLLIEKQRLEKFTGEIDTNLISINDKTKAMFKERQEELKQLEVKNASQKKELEMKQEFIGSINKEMQEKNIIVKNIQEQIKLKAWLDNFFLNLMQTMERYVLNSILKEFNEYFKEWFDMLIEDENISVRLDDSFTPLIEQNGYENYIQNLSGGEKTSVALAYRLALNKVINDFVSTIRTKGLLILDEPTDGFSSNQLDKLRDVLMQIKSKQIILVSHESKLESYADNIIRISKEHHVSSIV